MASKGRKWIQGAIKNPGALTATARKYGMSPLEFARKVKAGIIKAGTTTKRRANLALTLARLSKRRKSKR